ncbi:uncharacterized protein G2W53_032681 [Senna tora]|uniref:Uncharacterized protein n=1 Tax=Senna tora TaxID=362788 RepID=A0A834SWV7_9FABA|nr:uncharacterized protein G2W53_032681 [Senna tora]
MNEHTHFRLLQETLRSSTFTLDAQHAHHQTMKEVLASVNTTNELLTSIQHLLQKQITMASISAAAKNRSSSKSSLLKLRERPAASLIS